MSVLEAKVKTLPEPYQEFWYERSGIYMDSGATQPEADKLAWADLQRWIKNGGNDDETHGS